MEGSGVTGVDSGVTPRLCEDLFKRLRALSQGETQGAASGSKAAGTGVRWSWTVSCTYIELYQERLLDLLMPEGTYIWLYQGVH